MGEVFTVLGIPFNGDFGARVKSVIRKDNKSYREVYTNEQKEIKLSKRISAGRSDCMVLGGRYFAGKKRLLGRENVQDAKESCSYKKMTFLIGNQDCSVMKKTLSLKENGK